MSPPLGLDIPPGHVLRIRKSLYGLKQAARDWNATCTTALRKLGFNPTQADPCILVHPDRIIIGLHVDDMLVAAKTLSQVNEFKTELGQCFKIKDLGEIEKFLSIRIIRDREAHTIILDQQGYLERFFQECGMLQDTVKPIAIPINSYEALRTATTDDARTDKTEYQYLIRSLLYAIIQTRPDTAFLIRKLSQYISDPANFHRKAVKHLIRYLRSSAALRLRY